MTQTSTLGNKLDFASAQATITTENVQAHTSEIRGRPSLLLIGNTAIGPDSVKRS